MITDKREYYLDWLRFFVVALLVPHHVAITFSFLGNTYVYSEMPSRSLYYFIQFNLLNLFFMRLLFFISGVSTYLALKKRTVREYLAERFMKLLLPTVFAIITICPLTAFLRARISFGYTGSLLKFYPEFVKGFVDKYLGYGQFWFLVYLFVFSLLALPLFAYLKKRPHITEAVNSRLAKGKNIFYPMLLIIIFEAAFRPFFPGFQNLYADWANFTVYLSIFIMGYIFSQSRALMAKIAQSIPHFLVTALLSSIIFTVMEFGKTDIELFTAFYKRESYLYEVIQAAFRGAAAYTWVMTLIGAGKRYINFYHKTLVYLSRSSFALYIYHFIILSYLLYFLLPTGLNHYVIFTVTILSTYVLFYIIYELLIKRIWPLRVIAGLKVKR